MEGIETDFSPSDSNLQCNEHQCECEKDKFCNMMNEAKTLHFLHTDHPITGGKVGSLSNSLYFVLIGFSPRKRLWFLAAGQPAG